MMGEVAQLDDMMGELDSKIHDQKRRKTETRRQMEEMAKGVQGMQQFKPNQMEGVLTTLDELKDKNTWITEKLQGIEDKMTTKLQDLDELVQGYDKKQELN